MLRRDLVADPEIFCLASYATCKQPKYWLQPMIWAIPAATNLLTYKPALSFVFGTKICLSAMVEFYKGGGEDESKMGFELVSVIEWSHDPISVLLFP